MAFGLVAVAGVASAHAAPASAATLTHATSEEAGGTPYTISPGDHLIGIAKAHGTTVDALRMANEITGSKIIAGETLRIPGASPNATTKAAHPNRGASAAGTSYRIKSGDTLSGIAKGQGVTVDQLRQANPTVTSDVILAGATITIPPATSASKDRHKVPSTFAGRGYPKDVVAAAQRNKDTLMSRQVPSRAEMRAIVARTARAYGVDPKIALAISYQESGFNMRAVSPANAIGAMQVIPSSVAWASSMAGRTLDALNPHDNATAGVLVLKANLKATDTEEDGIAAYYQGLRSVRTSGMYADTKSYVSNVQALKARF